MTEEKANCKELNTKACNTFTGTCCVTMRPRKYLEDIKERNGRIKCYNDYLLAAYHLK